MSNTDNQRPSSPTVSHDYDPKPQRNLSLNHKPFWVFFFKDTETGEIAGSVCGHNARADYKLNPYYIGCQEIEVDMENLK